MKIRTYLKIFAVGFAALGLSVHSVRAQSANRLDETKKQQDEATKQKEKQVEMEQKLHDLQAQIEALNAKLDALSKKSQTGTGTPPAAQPSDEAALREQIKELNEKVDQL